MKSVIKSLALVTAGVLFLFASPVKADMLVRYTFDEASSGTTNALNTGTLGSAGDGVFQGHATRTSSTPGGASLAALALNPDGTNNNAVGPSGDLNGLDALSTITVSTWLNVQSDRAGPAANYSILGSDQNWTTANGWAFYFTGNGNALHLNFEVNAPAGAATATLNAANTWVFVAATWDHSTGALKFYAGTPSSAVTQVGSTVTLAGTMLDNPDPMRVGANPTTDGVGDRTPNAFLDDFRVYNTVLDQPALDAVRLEGVMTPEPASLSLVILGGVALLRRRRV